MPIMLRALLLVCLLGAAAHADVTIQNFDSFGIGWAHGIVRTDVNGDQLVKGDAGTLDQFSGDPLFYIYGTDSAGSQIGYTSNLWNGFTVYSSPDLKVWTPIGAYDGKRMFQATPAWQTMCNGTAFSGHSVCWLPRMIYSPTLGKYLLWFTNTSNIYNVQCTAKNGGCSTSFFQTSCGGGHTVYGGPWVDSTGTGYITYTDLSDANYAIYVSQLTTDLTDCTGTAVLVNRPATGLQESSGMFKRGSTYYVLFGVPNCPYCVDGVESYYATASAPMGPWTNQGQFTTSKSCGGQIIDANHYVIAGTDTYIYFSYEWNPGNRVSGQNGAANQQTAAQFWGVLSFSGTAISTLNCTSYVLPGVTPASPPVFANVDQSDESGTPASASCPIAGAAWYAQTFTAGVSARLAQIWLPLLQGNNTCTEDGCANTAGVNADLTVTVNSISSGNPGTVLATTTVPAASARWDAMRQTIPIPGNVTMTAGTQYAIVLSSPSATNGCWGYLAGVGNPYTGGAALVSSNSGSTWTALANNADLLFSTGPVPPNIGSGAVGLRR